MGVEMIQNLNKEIDLKNNAAFETQLVTFYLAGEEFGLPISKVKEIVSVPVITRLPKAPDYIEGIANLRGNILPLVNLRLLFGLPSEEKTEDTRAVVVEINGRAMGIIVDRVMEVMNVDNGHIAPPPAISKSSVDANYLQGVARLNHGKRLVLLLDAESLLPSIEFSQSKLDKVDESVFAATEAIADKTLHETQLVTFRLGSEEFAINIMHVQEIIRMTELSKIPNAPEFVEGVLSLRDQLLPIVNLRKKFNMPLVEVTEDSRVIVMNLDKNSVGILVDSMSEVLMIDNKTIEGLPSFMNDMQTEQLNGVAKLQDGKRLIMIMDVEKVLSINEFNQIQSEVETSEGNSESSNESGDAGDSDVKTGAEQSIAVNANTDEDQYVTFEIGKERFGVNISQVQEIIWLTDITHVPNVRNYIEGVVNLRGNVLPVMDIRKRFHLAEIERTDSSSIVVVDVDSRKTGVIVDAVSNVMRLNRNAIEPPPPIIAGLDASFVKGVGKIKNDERMLIILNLEEVVAR
jgi:purine-binding chemotaxis protein CheW